VKVYTILKIVFATYVAFNLTPECQALVASV